jgi:hypothetical protein
MVVPEIEMVVGRAGAGEAGGGNAKKFRAGILGARGGARLFPHGKTSISQDNATWMQHYTACS